MKVDVIVCVSNCCGMKEKRYANMEMSSFKIFQIVWVRLLSFIGKLCRLSLSNFSAFFLRGFRGLFSLFNMPVENQSSV